LCFRHCGNSPNTSTLQAQSFYNLNFKVGKTVNIDVRRASYAKCRGKEIIWSFYYPTSNPKLVGT
jgi:hypothetical protein